MSALPEIVYDIYPEPQPVAPVQEVQVQYVVPEVFAPAPVFAAPRVEQVFSAPRLEQAYPAPFYPSWGQAPWAVERHLDSQPSKITAAAGGASAAPQKAPAKAFAPAGPNPYNKPYTPGKNFEKKNPIGMSTEKSAFKNNQKTANHFPQRP
jgi:hypothetical protein